MKKLFAIIAAALALAACSDNGTPPPAPPTPKNAYVESVTVNNVNVPQAGAIGDVDPLSVTVDILFSADIDAAKLDGEMLYVSGEGTWKSAPGADSKTLRLTNTGALGALSKYTLYIQQGQNMGIKLIDSYQYGFTTAPPSTPVFPEITDDQLMTKIQEQTFKYFWAYAHPVSGLARERLNSGNTVTTGGSGFGIAAFPAAVSRGFITRAEALERSLKIVEFLSEKAQRFHGAYSHWLNGETGKAIQFSDYDNGADLVETAFLIQGLLVLQAYFDGSDTAETNLREGIQTIWEAVEWDWFRQDGQNVLYWHWSPDHGWKMNMKIQGWNEGLIVYVLAASSPTHSIPPEVYTEGWARSGAMKNGNTYYDVTLPLGEAYGGPMFFAHYSFLGLDPRNLRDQYADYWTQNTAHATINFKYCVDNPQKKAGYSAKCWGLTASDIPNGYTASSPTNDRGVIAPTAALASMPYTPEQSKAAMNYFYYYLGGKLWGDYGFRDSFSIGQLWFAPSFLAIDQGPIIVMIENYRTGLVWDIFMSRDDIRAGLTKLGFTYAE